MLGFAREEVIGRCSIQLGIWRHPEQRNQLIEALRDNKQIRDLQVELCTRSGEVRHVLGSAETIQLKGEPCIIAIFNDLTPRLHLEAQLRQAQKMEAVGQLAAGIAHDFNNILTIVQGHVGLLLHEPGDEQGRAGSLTEIRNAADRAANLTQQLLTFSRRQPVQARLLDVNEVIGNMSTMLRRLLGEPITLRYQQARSLPAVRLDLGMMEQVIMNLAVNARDAMPGGGTLTFATMHSIISEEYVWRNPEAKAGGFVRITVSDTGCGMSPDTLNRVFEPFFTTKEVGKGTGLGLATVYGIIKQHQGWIEVKSEVNRGTTFDIYLPEQESAPPTPVLQRGHAPVQGGKETILLVEDEPGVRRLAENVLARHGYQVLSAADGREALDVWQQNSEQIDLLLTDMVMPQGLSGLDLAGQLRIRSPRLKVIYTSGYSVELLESELTLNEGVNFLPKPYPAGQLAAVVRNCLDS
jgi:two-component system cell cycle sensor histidine kinase/response regulator CckA